MKQLLNSTTKIFLAIMVLYAFICPKTDIYAKGCNGKYIIKGVMYNSKSKQPLVKEKILINNQVLYTDSLGRYSFVVEYRTTDKYSNFVKSYIENSRLNDKQIEFIIDGKTKRIKNKWRKYGLKYCFKSKVYVLEKSFYW